MSSSSWQAQTDNMIGADGMIGTGGMLALDSRRRALYIHRCGKIVSFVQFVQAGVMNSIAAVAEILMRCHCRIGWSGCNGAMPVGGASARQGNHMSSQAPSTAENVWSSLLGF